MEQVGVHAAVDAADALIAESIAMGGVVERRYTAALSDESVPAGRETAQTVVSAVVRADY